MGVANQKLQQALRLDHKSLESHFVQEISTGLNCSPFEAKAVLDVVREVFYPYLDSGSQPMPGCISLVAVDADEPAGKPISRCRMRTVVLRVHRGVEDDKLLQDHGPDGFRRALLPDICQEALSKGVVLTREDLAYRIFFVSPRTISRDLAALRKADPKVVIPLRSIRHDIGPVLTHRSEIVRLALDGKTTVEICRIMHHSPEAVANYLSTFARCAQLHEHGFEPSEIAYVLHKGPKLIEGYLELVDSCRRDKNRAYHLQRLRQLGQFNLEKKHPPKTQRRRMPK